MKSYPLTRAGWSVSCLLTLATVSFSQTSQTGTQTPTPSSTPVPTPLRIIYTGKFMGYLRVPSLQSINVTSSEVRRCPATSNNDSQAAIKFMAGPADSEERKKFDSAIRVSTGDNFAPQLEARVFEVTQTPNAGYTPGNKELYDWDDKNHHWVLSRKLPRAWQQQKALGSTTIPTDNVACFLAAAHYTAVVPGKH